MLEKIKNKFIRFLYFKMYGYYPYLFPTNFILGMVGFNSLLVRRELLLDMHFIKLLKNHIDNPAVLVLISFYVPGSFVRVRSHFLFYVPRARTNILRRSPRLHALASLNSVLGVVTDFDFFVCSIDTLKKAILAFLPGSIFIG